jgi:UDP-N-acetyl-2-amino-2-deoxyglucuronate dehydrogenase
MTVGAALLGATGMWGARIAEAAARTTGLRLVSCYARDAEKNRAFAEARGLDAASSLEEAIEADGVEVALLVTPNDLHAEQALFCADRGTHVFVEKPIASTVADAERMRDRFAEVGLVLAVGHGMRRLGAARRVKELLDEGALGTVVLAEANWSLPSRLTPQAWRWYRDRAQGGPLIQLGIHHADTLAYWLGAVARSFGAFARVATDAESDDVGVVGLEFESGAVGAITGSYVSPRTYFLRLYGDKAALEYEIDMAVWPRAHEADGATTLTLRSPDWTERVGFERRDPLAEELDELARAVRGEVVFETGPDEGIAALRVILDALPAR